MEQNSFKMSAAKIAQTTEMITLAVPLFSFSASAALFRARLHAVDPAPPK